MQKRKTGEREISFLALAVRSAAVVVFLFALSHVALAQSTATVQGAVTDTSNAAIPGATVVVHNQNTGVERTTKTDQSGGYLVPGLLPGLYQITISANGFQAFVIKDLKLDVATTVTENAQLKVGQITEQVTVTGGTPLVNTSNVTIGQVISQRTVQEIPLNGRHFVDLALLSPGTVTPPQNGFLTFPLQGLGSLGINTAGQRENTTNWIVNGINLNDEVQNQITFQPSIDTVSEFKVDNSNFPAEYGRNSGSIVTIATRSGTNAFHGQMFEYLRNNFFDARNFFNVKPRPQSPLIRNQFGADFGGPIKKNKLLFFLSYEGQRQRVALNLVTPVPAAGTTSSSTAVNNLLKLLPAPNGTLAGQPAFFGNTSAPVNVDQGTGDITYVVNQSDQINGYYAIEVDHRFEPTAGASVPGFGDTRDARRQLLTLNEDHVFGPNMTNEVRLGFNRIHITFLPNDISLNSASLGINLPPGVPTAGLPDIFISGGPAFGNPGGEPQGRGDTTVVLGDTLNWLKGRNNFAFGGEIRRFYNNNLFENTGFFSYSPTVVNGVVTATALQNFINDGASTFSTLSGNGNNKILESAWGLFAQDNYKLKSNITLELGLRYDWNSTPTEANNRFSVFDPSTGTLVQVGSPGFGQIYQTNNKNFQPRIGIAWDPSGDGKTSVRAGYAILTQQPVTNIASNLTGNPPFATPLAASGPNNITLENPPANPKTVSPSSISQNYHDSYAQDWNLSIQREITNTLGIQVAYIGIKGTHLQQQVNLNQPPVVNGIYQSAGPFSNFSEIINYNSAGTSNYNALWVTVNKHMSHGLDFLGSYTFSRSLDYSSLDVPNNLPQDSNNLQNEYGPSDFNATHRFVLSGFYQLPFKGNRVISGWELGLITQAQSGNPLTVFFPGANGLFPGATLRPNVTGPVQVTGNINHWIANPSVFTSPCTTTSGVTTCSPGNLGRNTIIGPKFVNTDFSVIKNTKINQRFNLQFRAEAFDVFNHPNFGDPNLSLGSSSFGVITSTRFGAADFGSSRQIQLALKLQF
ncbi:MAG TPA: TonB-dependent receptor [Candidatus Limnocylindrales bacterium]|nr:TonB-dependent receptor [Candidatus Limnocylindrales bacterium]